MKAGHRPAEGIVMIYKLTSFGGESEVVGELRKFSFEADKLTITGVTIQDARNILAVLATGQVGAPITYGGAIQEIVNTGAPGPVTNSALTRDAKPAYEVQAAEAPSAEKAPKTTEKALLGSDILQAVAKPARAERVVIPEAELKAAEAGEPAPAFAKEEPREKKPAALRSRAPEAINTDKISKIADQVAKEVSGTPAQPQPKVVVTEPSAPTAAGPFLLDRDNLPAWLTQAQTMRVMLTGFLQNLQTKDYETIYRECMNIKDKVPFIAKDRFEARLAAGIEQLYGE